MACGQCLGRDGAAAGMDGNIDHGGNSKKALAGTRGIFEPVTVATKRAVLGYGSASVQPYSTPLFFSFL